jgi:transcriptional regulator with XRE-family HTH domain
MGDLGDGSYPDVQAASELTNRQLGAEIRRIRTHRGLTLVDIAADTGLSASMLSMLERGKTGVSVGSLVAVASALGVAVGDLFHPSRTPELSLVRLHEQQELTICPGVTRRVIQRSRAHGLEVASLRLDPGAHTGAELVRHEGQEIVVVQLGSLTVQIGEAHNVLGAGDSIRLDAQCPHRFANDSADVSEALLVVGIAVPNTHGH